jgi:hypothetical protein
MRLWLLQPKEPGKGPWAGYDVAEGFVIRAETEAQARRMAQEHGGDECSWWPARHPTWLNEELTTCTPLAEDGEAGVILRDFSAG